MAFYNHATDLQDQLSGHTHVLSLLDFYGEKRHACASCSELACRQNKGITYLTKDKVMQLENAGLQQLQRQVHKNVVSPV